MHTKSLFIKKVYRFQNNANEELYHVKSYTDIGLDYGLIIMPTGESIAEWVNISMCVREI